MTLLRLVSLSVLLLFGCYDAKVPLGAVEDAPMDHELAGRWEPVGPGWDCELALLRIVPFNEHEYYIEFSMQSRLDAQPETMRLRTFMTRVEGLTFANNQMVEEEDKDYLIVQYEITEDGRLGFRQIDHEMDHIETSSELYQFVSKLIESGSLYEEDMLYFKRVP